MKAYIAIFSFELNSYNCLHCRFATMNQKSLEEALNSFMFEYKGIYFYTGSTTPEIIDSLEHMEIRDSDVFLVTYPKSGTIWTQQVLNLIMHERHRNGLEHIDNMTRAPWIEYNLHNDAFNSRQSPRLFTSHLPYYLMPKDLRFKRAKIIYVYRNPKDVLVSFYHFHKLYQKLEVTLEWETFLGLFLSGRVTSGSWFDHIKGWYTHKEDYNILFLTYEEMKKDLRSAVIKICNFVDIKLDDDALGTVLEKSSFKSMRQDPLANYRFISKKSMDFEKGEFLRKVLHGSWFDHIKGWYTHKEDYNILFMTYEELKKDLRSAVIKICNFLDIKLNDDAVDTVVDKSSFKNMKQDPLANYKFISEKFLDFEKGEFLRKGTIGDWKNRMTVAQNEKFDKVYMEKMKDLPIKFFWDINDEEQSLLE
ncbi:amine sulfotransferase-like [Pyxicephalus adspersus]|uniref:amine sulfotransferase-like n=1 Tax=Pyxicephalus adspersus TaxID=30357 RepID=UPI003B5C8B17